jgi:E3 ubiquitin-protein ligase UBR4
VATGASLTVPGGGGAGGGVNKAIQQLAQRYCNECHHVFDELSKIIQKVVACRRGLMEFDRKQLEIALRSAASLPASSSSTPSDVLRQLPTAVEVVSCEQSRSRLVLRKSQGCTCLHYRCR